MKSLSRAYDFLRLKVCFQRRQNANKAAVVTESTARVFTASEQVLLIRYEISQRKRESEN